MNIKLRFFLILALVTSFSVLTVLILSGGLDSFENGIYDGMVRHANPTLANVMLDISNIGSYAIVTSVIAALFLFPFTRIKFGIPIAINAILNTGFYLILKTLLFPNRMDASEMAGNNGFSYPSGHAMYNAAFYAMVSYIVFREIKNKKLRFCILSLSLVITICIGISRVYLGVHTMADVVVGWMLGAVIAYFVDALWRRVLLDTNS